MSGSKSTAVIIKNKLFRKESLLKGRLFFITTVDKDCCLEALAHCILHQALFVLLPPSGVFVQTGLVSTNFLHEAC